MPAPPIDFVAFQRHLRFLTYSPLAAVAACVSVPPFIYSMLLRRVTINGPLTGALAQFIPARLLTLKMLGLHLAFLVASARYRALLRLLIRASGFSGALTRSLACFLSMLPQLTGLGNLQSDIPEDTNNLKEFFARQKPSIRKRMMNQIPKSVEGPPLKVSTVPHPGLGIIPRRNDFITWENIKLQWSHCSRYNMKAQEYYYHFVTLLLLDARITEYRAATCGRENNEEGGSGRLVAQCVSIRNNGSLVILQYSCAEDCTANGLWFYNVREHFRQALDWNAHQRCQEGEGKEAEGTDQKVEVVCGTGADHKAEAKLNAGLVICKDKKDIERAYGI